MKPATLAVAEIRPHSQFRSALAALFVLTCDSTPTAVSAWF